MTKKLMEYFNKAPRLGTLSTADKSGKIDSAVLGSPRMTDEKTVVDEIKRLSPGTIVVAGGHHATLSTSEVMQHPTIDMAIVGEGEKPFLALLNTLAEGRPLSDVVNELDYPNLIDDACEVLHSLVFCEKQVETHDHRWFRVRIMPYRTQGNMIDGVVATFIDISATKRLEAALRTHTAV